LRFFRNNRAVGVEYIKDTHGDVHTVSYAHASRLVVVAAGAFGSPTILERSGIGAKSLLEEKNVHLVADLPGVGESYQGRFYFFPYYFFVDID
jgi:alcohol oxidase